jgi:SHS2 domain-containing protein
MTWRIAPHTADLAIEAEGPDGGACLDAAGLALTSIITGSDTPHELGSDEEVRFHLDAPDAQSLAVAFLAELLWISESKDLLWTGGGVEYSILNDGTHRAAAVGNAVKFDPSMHGHGVEVKAITYHEVRFAQAKNYWSLRVLIDI